MGSTVLHICFEAQENEQGQYLVYSMKFSDEQNVKPTFTREAVIKGPPSMGCGLFDSKIVLAGGELEGIKKKDIITFDMNTKETSTDTFPPTRRGKLKPLVFQLNNRLYVFDTGSYINKRSFEFLSNKKKLWHRVYNPFSFYIELSDCVSPDTSINYSFLAIGSTVYMSSPRGPEGFLHHSNYTYKSWSVGLPKLPFAGVATFYYQPGYSDLLVITFNNGLVEARQFCRDVDPIISEPLFAVDRSWRSGGAMTGYFADFGDGNFCLTAFDSVCICVYKFKILRLGKDDDDTWDCIISYKGRTFFNEFVDNGSKISSVVGCFAP